LKNEHNAKKSKKKGVQKEKRVKKADEKLLE
jgi:hypothetical protein